MTIEQQAEELTKAYVASYNTAMQKVRNPEFAAQIAGTVTFTINATPPKQQAEVNPVMGLGLLTQLMIAARQGEQEPEETGNKKKK